MGNITKINASRQSRLSQLPLNEIVNFIDEGDTILYRRENGSLGMATKNGGLIEDINPGGDVIKNLPIPNLPTDNLDNPIFPGTEQAYALCAVRDGQEFKMVWALVDTSPIDYND